MKKRRGYVAPVCAIGVRLLLSIAVVGSFFPGCSKYMGAKVLTEIQEVKMVSIPAGIFQMGSTSVDSDDKPVHTVTLSAFEMSVYEITQGEYKALMGTNPSSFTGDENLPVEMVSWWDAIKYRNALSAKAGLQQRYNESTGECDFTKNGFRLPTEAEWEYACRAGTETNFYTGNNLSSNGHTSTDLDTAGWYEGNSGSKEHPVGEKVKNAWGLFDMHGNVWEWCNDWYDDSYYSSSPPADPTGPSTGSYRVRRGGGWHYHARYCRSAFRYGGLPTRVSTAHGIRIVRRP